MNPDPYWNKENTNYFSSAVKCLNYQLCLQAVSSVLVVCGEARLFLALCP